MSAGADRAPLRRRWAWPPSGLLRYAPPRLRAAKPSETLAPGAESTYNNNQPNGDLSELTKKRLPLAPLSAPPLFALPSTDASARHPHQRLGRPFSRPRHFLQMSKGCLNL